MEYGQSKSLYALRRQACCHGKEVNAISGGVAQLGEHLPCKQGVRSSILLISTKGRRKTKERRPSPETNMGL